MTKKIVLFSFPYMKIFLFQNALKNLFHEHTESKNQCHNPIKELYGNGVNLREQNLS